MVYISIANPFAFLWKAVTDCDNFAKFFHSRMIAKPPTPEAPWQIILYSDEVTPGNPLATNNMRKFQAIYWSFLEFGVNALSREESWFCVMTEYSHKVKDLAAGLSQAIGAIMKVFFSANGMNFETGGIELPFEPNAQL